MVAAAVVFLLLWLLYRLCFVVCCVVGALGKLDVWSWMRGGGEVAGASSLPHCMSSSAGGVLDDAEVATMVLLA